MARCAPSWARNYHSPRRPARIKRSLNPEPAARLCSSADKRRSQDTQLWHISCGTKRTLRDVCHLSASLIGPSGSSTFRPSTTPVSMSLTGLALLFGLGAKALPSWGLEDEVEQSFGGLAVSVTAGPSGQTISPHPSFREGHHSTAGSRSISSYCTASTGRTHDRRIDTDHGD